MLRSMMNICKIERWPRSSAFGVKEADQTLNRTAGESDIGGEIIRPILADY